MPVKKRRIYYYAEIILSVSGNLVRRLYSDTLEEVQKREKTESVEVSDETENEADETEQTLPYL